MQVPIHSSVVSSVLVASAYKMELVRAAATEYLLPNAYNLPICETILSFVSIAIVLFNFFRMRLSEIERTNALFIISNIVCFSF